VIGSCRRWPENRRPRDEVARPDCHPDPKVLPAGQALAAPKGAAAAIQANDPDKDGTLDLAEVKATPMPATRATAALIRERVM
jgi:hypothetical protein